MLVNYYQILVTSMPLIPLALGIYVFRKLGDKLKILFYYICITAVADIVSSLVARTGTNTMPGAHIYVPVELVVLTLFYANYVKEYISKKYIWIIIGTFVIISIMNALFFQKVTVYPNIPRAVECIVMVIYSVLYFHKVMVEAKIKKLSKEPMIWINTGILCYFSFDFFFHISFPAVLASSVEFAKGILYFFWATNIMFYSILAIGFYKQKKLAEL